MNDLLHKITPLEVDHIDILDGQVAFVDTSRQERPELWMHDLQLSVENLTNRVRLTEGRPVLLTASATLARSGAVSLLITADPFEKGLTFSGRAAIVGLETAELYRFIEPATNLQAPEGTIDIFVEFDCRNGQLTGGVKPVLKNVKIRPDDKGFFSALKAWVADLAVKLFSDRVRDRNAVATVIPIKGTLTGPDVELWPAIFGVLRNAFVEGLASGYAYLPPKSRVPRAARPGRPDIPVREPQLLAPGCSMTRPRLLDLTRLVTLGFGLASGAAAPTRTRRLHRPPRFPPPSPNASRRSRLDCRSRAPLTASCKTAPS